MIPAIVMMCALLPPAFQQPCRTPDARAIAAAIDAATDDDGLRAHLVVYSFHESGFALRPAPKSRDARSHESCGPWQQRCGLVEGQPLSVLPRAWLHDVQASSLAGVDSSPSRAYRRAKEAQKLLELVRN